MNSLDTDLAVGIHLHARVFRRTQAPPGAAWYVDIDDLDDPQPDDPYWYGYFCSQRAAIDAACERMAAAQAERLYRLSETWTLTG
ncbi:hypothetical protein [Kribbella deserti]|uniref:Uncharacterized protein n=1 Tax=Kribbella deserti TaxID=1926257 RepID=A0ABV6QPH4_9ACTN